LEGGDLKVDSIAYLLWLRIS